MEPNATKPIRALLNEQLLLLLLFLRQELLQTVSYSVLLLRWIAGVQ